MATHQALLSFNNGEGSPYLRRRIDFDKTGSTCEVLRNFLPLAFGAVTKRPGLVELIETLVAGTNSKAFPFVASDGSKYVLHFNASETTQRLRVYRADGTQAASKVFFETHVFPEPWADGSLRDLQMENVNDVAFFTHPSIHPFVVSRVADADWDISFMEFKSAPMLDENLDENRLLSVVSNPIADTWADATSYDEGDVVFSGRCEWKCKAGHTSDTDDNMPGSGTDWRDFWKRKFFEEGDAITITARDKKAPAAWGLQYESYLANYIGRWPGDTADDYSIAFVNHTMDATYEGGDWTFHTSRNYTTPSSLYTTTWVTIHKWEHGEHTSSGWVVGTLVWRNGKVYRCILDHLDDGNTARAPETGANWATYWVFLINLPGTVPDILISGEYDEGDEVSRKGREYVCTAQHTPDTTDNRPGSGTDWEDFWTETSLFLESFAISEVSPGTYWRLSPERDDQDFQVELVGNDANDGEHSPEIAVDGGWNVYTYGTWEGIFHLEKSTDKGASWDTIRSWQSRDDRNVSDHGDEETPCLLRLRYEAIPGTDDNTGNPRALLIPEQPYVTGEALMTEYVDADEMRGFARSAMLSGPTFRWAQGAFSEEFGFPRAVCLHESRLCFAGTARNPVSLWISKSDDLDNFEVGTLDDAGLFETLPTGNAAPIRWLATQRRLFIGTRLGEWVVGSETSDQPLTPENYFVRGYTNTGSDGQAPVKTTSGLLFAGRKGGRLYELQYTTETGYEATDLSRLAEHLTQPGILAMAWQQTREPGMWLVTRTGGLLHFAYSKAERVFAWSRHDMEGALFRDVVIFPSDEGDDEVFFIVDIATESFLMRIPQHWQEGMETGDPVTYTDGPDALAIVSELVSMPIDMQSETGTTQARNKRSHQLCLDVYKSKGGEVWNRDIEKRQAIKDTATANFTGWVDVKPDSGALVDLQLKIYHDAAEPFTLRAAVVRWQLNEP
jgi:hypothetical protein